MHSHTDKRKQKTIASPFYALAGSITTPNVSRTPSLHKVVSAPDLSIPIQDLLISNQSVSTRSNRSIDQHLNISDELLPLKPFKKRVMTVPTNLSEYHHPFIVLELLLNLPMECHMGITDNLKPMIDKAIVEQTKLEEQQNQIIEEQIRLIQQTKQQINLYKEGKINETETEEEYEMNYNDIKSDISSLPAAPLAIPPTASNAINNNKNENHHHPFTYTKLQRPSRQASISQFRSVLQEGYTLHLMIAIMQALVGAFLSGYNTSVLNVPSLIIQDECDLNMSKYSSLQSFYCLGGLIGALCIGKIADKFGRKCAIIIFDIIFIISGLLIFGYANGIFGARYDMFIIFATGRCLSGCAAGIATTIIPIYLGEISPPLIRGAIGTLNQLTISMGLLISEICGYHKIFGNETLWPYLFALNVILPILQIFTLWSLPESPKWLITKNDEYEARKVLQYLRQCSNVEMDLHFTKLINEFQHKQIIHNENENENNNYGSINHKQQKKKKWKINKILLYAITIAIGLQILQQFSGINSIFYYSNLTLINAGFVQLDELWIGNVLIAAANFVSVLIPVYLMDKWGRKTLLNISLCGMILSCIGFSICLIIYPFTYISMIFLITYVISFEIGLGPIPWLMCAEITPSSHRAVIVSIATFFNWATNLLIAQFANKLIQYAQFFPFAAICICGALMINKIIPETKGKTEIQIQQELYNK